MGYPRASASVIVLQDGLEAIQANSKPGFRGSMLLELKPQPQVFFPLVLRKEAVNPLRSDPFPFSLVDVGFIVVAENIPSIDLNKIVEKHHLQHPHKVHRLIHILLEKARHHCQVPGMLRIVFPAGSIHDEVLAKNLLEFVYFNDERQLLVQTCFSHYVTSYF
jgi:hypothetical protein